MFYAFSRSSGYSSCINSYVIAVTIAFLVAVTDLIAIDVQVADLVAVAVAVAVASLVAVAVAVAKAWVR